MRNYVIINGVNSLNIQGLAINTLPPITKPMIRTQREEIDGRDGDLITELGYSAYDKQMEIGLYGNYDINDIISYFSGEGTIVFSNEDDKYYNFKILDQIDYEKLLKFKTATIKFHCQPFKYPIEETPVKIEIETITASGENLDINNTAEALMKIDLKGNTSQNGTPTPSAPVEVNTVTGNQNITVCGKNLLNIENIVKGRLDSGEIGYVSNTTALTLNNNSFAFTTNANSRGVTTDYIGVESGSYTISSDNLNSTYGLKVACYDSTKIWLQDATFTGNASEKRKIITIPSGTSFIRIYFSLSSAGSITITNPQVEKGNTPSIYEEYKGNEYDINLGKNLFDKNSFDWVRNNSADYTKTTDTSTNRIRTQTLLKLEGGVTYTISGIPSNMTINAIKFYSSPSDTEQTSFVQTSTFTVPSNATFIIIQLAGSNFDSSTNSILKNANIQIEKGSQSTSYVEYKTPIELCKIGDYQDIIYKNNDKWYLYKEIGKIVLDGSENWAKSGSTAIDRFYIELESGVLSNYNNQVAFSDRFYYNTNTIVGTMQLGSFQNNTRLFLDYSTYGTTTLSQFKTWLNSNNTIAYYVLTTPTTTEITDNELISQLEATLGAKSYDSTTHIFQTTPNKPFILDVVAIKKGTDTALIDNEGNIYSKPIIYIEGNGIAYIYLNGNQMFTIDLSEINECVIDIANLEAYNPNTSILMNRKVTGDYSKFMLNPGENQIKIDGAVTKATISNYTRWL